MKKPDFIIAAFPRSGTSQIYNYLGQHPQVRLGKQDLWFFKDPSIFAKGFEWYQSQFENSDYIQGEATAHYFYLDCIVKIQKFCPWAKLIFCLRYPVDRAYSHYWRRVLKARATDPFAKLNREIIYHGEPHSEPNIIHTSLYGYWLKQILPVLSEPPLVIISENAATETPPYQQTMNKVFDYLGLSPHEIIAHQDSELTHKTLKYLKYPWLHKFPMSQRIVHRIPLFWSTAEPPRNKAFEKELTAIYRNDLSILEKLLPRHDFSIWKERYGYD